MEYALAHWKSWTWSLGIIGGAIVVALVVRFILFLILDRLARRNPSVLKTVPNVLQVTDTSEHSVQIRALMDARDSSLAWDLRCYVREKLIQFLQQHHPQSLPRYRGEFRASTEIRSLPGSLGGAAPPPSGAHAA